jgi:hypothetical protein
VRRLEGGVGGLGERRHTTASSSADSALQYLGRAVRGGTRTVISPRLIFVSARAGNRRFRLLSALRDHTQAPYKLDFHRLTLRALIRPWAARTV